MTLRVPVAGRDVQETKTNLDIADREALFQLTQLPGYRVLLRLMEMKCILQDATLMSVDAADEKRVLAEHRITQAKWEFFADIQKQVAFECNELINPPVAGEIKSKEQVEIEGIVDPLAQQE